MFPPQWHNVLNILCSYLNGTMGPSKTRPARHIDDVGLSALLHQILPVGHHQDLDVEIMDVDAYDNNTTLMVFAHFCIGSLDLAFRLELLVGQKA